MICPMEMLKKMEMMRDDKAFTSEQFDIPEAIFKENELALHKELFLEPSKQALMQLSENFLDFGFCESMTVSGQKEI